MQAEIETLEIFERLLPCSFNKCTTARAHGVRCNFVPACINKPRGSIGYFSTDPRWAETPNISSGTIIKLSFSLTLSNCFSWTRLITGAPTVRYVVLKFLRLLFLRFLFNFMNNDHGYLRLSIKKMHCLTSRMVLQIDLTKQ